MMRMPGSILMSRLKVYDTPTIDGQRGGTPHMHLLCTEMYFVLSGSGSVEMIDAKGFSCVNLEPLSALLFTPGTIHRLINPNRDLEILVLMQNSGLPERGDNVVCFTDEWLASDEKYAEAMRIASLNEAYRRRDRGVEGFLQLKAAFSESEEAGQAALQHFFDRAEQRTAHLRADWEAIVQHGSMEAALASLAYIKTLNAHNTLYLSEAQHYLISPQATTTPGFCGHLNRYFDPATLSPEGIYQS